jgi:serine/threonine protein kinase
MDTIPFPDELRDRFEPRRELGRGGMGVVFLAHDLQLDREVVVKLSRDGGDREASARAQREAQVLASLEHPNVLRVYDAGHTNDGPYLVMEHLVGRSLEQLPPATSLGPIFRQLADGLRAVHDTGLLHRDLKPANMFLEDSGRALLIDFGLVRDPRRTRLTRTGQVLGTLAFMAPECIRGEPATTASDWYGWAASLYACIEGHPPHPGPELLRYVTEDVALELRFRVTPGNAQPGLAALLDPLPTRRPRYPPAELLDLPALTPGEGPTQARRAPLVASAAPSVNREAVTVAVDAASLPTPPSLPAAPPPTDRGAGHAGRAPASPGRDAGPRHRAAAPRSRPAWHLAAVAATTMMLVGIAAYGVRQMREARQREAALARHREEIAQEKARADARAREAEEAAARQAAYNKEKARRRDFAIRRELWLEMGGPPSLKEVGAATASLRHGLRSDFEPGPEMRKWMDSWSPSEVAPRVEAVLAARPQEDDLEVIRSLISDYAVTENPPLSGLVENLLATEALHQLLRRAGRPAQTWAAEYWSRWLSVEAEEVSPPATTPVLPASLIRGYPQPRASPIESIGDLPEDEYIEAYYCDVPGGTAPLEAEVVYSLPPGTMQAPRIQIGLTFFAVLEGDAGDATDARRTIRWTARIPSSFNLNSRRARIDVKDLTSMTSKTRGLPFGFRELDVHSFEVRRVRDPAPSNR